MTIYFTYYGVSLFHDRTQSTKVPIAGQACFQPYSADVHAPYQLIAYSLKQLRREAIVSCSLIVFESLYSNFDLVMAVWCLYPFVIDWWRVASFSSAGINVAVGSKKSDASIILAPLAHLSPDYLYRPCRMTLPA